MKAAYPSILPLRLLLHVESPDHDGSHLQSSDGECVGSGPIRLDDLAVADGEVVQRVQHLSGGVLEKKRKRRNEHGDSSYVSITVAFWPDRHRSKEQGRLP